MVFIGIVAILFFLIGSPISYLLTNNSNKYSFSFIYGLAIYYSLTTALSFVGFAGNVSIVIILAFTFLINLIFFLKFRNQIRKVVRELVIIIVIATSISVIISIVYKINNVNDQLLFYNKIDALNYFSPAEYLYNNSFITNIRKLAIDNPLYYRIDVMIKERLGPLVVFFPFQFLTRSNALENYKYISMLSIVITGYTLYHLSSLYFKNGNRERILLAIISSLAPLNFYLLMENYLPQLFALPILIFINIKIINIFDNKISLITEVMGLALGITYIIGFYPEFIFGCGLSVLLTFIIKIMSCGNKKKDKFFTFMKVSMVSLPLVFIYSHYNIVLTVQHLLRRSVETKKWTVLAGAFPGETIGYFINAILGYYYPLIYSIRIQNSLSIFIVVAVIVAFIYFSKIDNKGKIGYYLERNQTNIYVILFTLLGAIPFYIFVAHYITVKYIASISPLIIFCLFLYFYNKINCKNIYLLFFIFFIVTFLHLVKFVSYQNSNFPGYRHSWIAFEKADIENTAKMIPHKKNSNIYIMTGDQIRNGFILYYLKDNKNKISVYRNIFSDIYMGNPKKYELKYPDEISNCNIIKDKYIIIWNRFLSDEKNNFLTYCLNNKIYSNKNYSLFLNSL